MHSDTVSTSSRAIVVTMTEPMHVCRGGSRVMCIGVMLHMRVSCMLMHMMTTVMMFMVLYIHAAHVAAVIAVMV